jgi:hypothetical protein
MILPELPKSLLVSICSPPDEIIFADCHYISLYLKLSSVEDIRRGWGKRFRIWGRIKESMICLGMVQNELEPM